MKYRYLVLVLLLCSFAFAQKPAAPAQSLPAKPAAKAPATTTGQAPAGDMPVITIYDLCKERLSNLGGCKTIVTRAQFERMLSALGVADAVPEKKRQVANGYAQLLTIATQAEIQGLDNRPDVQEQIRLTCMKTLATMFQQSLQDKAQITPAEIQKFYDDNRLQLTQLTLERVVVPAKSTADTKDKTTDMKAVADDLHQRAIKGVDFKSLQAEAYQKAGLQNPPDTKVVTSAGAIPAALKSLLQLQPGAVSDVMQGSEGFHFYKLVNQQVVPLEQVKDQITKQLVQKKVEQEITMILNSVNPNLNPDYFGPAPAGASAAPQEKKPLR